MAVVISLRERNDPLTTRGKPQRATVRDYFSRSRVKKMVGMEGKFSFAPHYLTQGDGGKKRKSEEEDEEIRGNNLARGHTGGGTLISKQTTVASKHLPSRVARPSQTTMGNSRLVLLPREGSARWMEKLNRKEIPVNKENEKDKFERRRPGGDVDGSR